MIYTLGFDKIIIYLLKIYNIIKSVYIMTDIINILNSSFNKLTSTISNNISLLQKFYINKKINNINNTNLDSIINTICNDIININTLLSTSSLFEYYEIFGPYIDDIRTYYNKIIISLMKNILSEQNVNYSNVSTLPIITNVLDLTEQYNKNDNNPNNIDVNFNIISIDISKFNGTVLKMVNLYSINFIFRYLTFKVNRLINIFNFVIRIFFT